MGRGGPARQEGREGFPILVPCHVKRQEKDEETGQTEEHLALVGFKHCIVFGYGQTEGTELAGNEWARQFIDALPLVDVAKHWGLTVQTYNANARSRYLGKYRLGQGIALGVENVHVWCHELIHAADHRLVGESFKGGQQTDQEIVADLGACVHLQCLGMTAESDPGWSWAYIQGYAQHAGLEPSTACQRVLKRTCDAVALVLSEYDASQQPAAAGVAA